MYLSEWVQITGPMSYVPTGRGEWYCGSVEKSKLTHGFFFFYFVLFYFFF